MKLKDFFKKKKSVTTETKTITETTVITEEKETIEEKEKKPFDAVAPTKIGVLDMVIAFDTTGSMAAYIDAVRQEVAELIPALFKKDCCLRLLNHRL